jgi:hypothetical protein
MQVALLLNITPCLKPSSSSSAACGKHLDIPTITFVGYPPKAEISRTLVPVTLLVDV